MRNNPYHLRAEEEYLSILREHLDECIDYHNSQRYYLLQLTNMIGEMPFFLTGDALRGITSAALVFHDSIRRTVTDHFRSDFQRMGDYLKDKTLQGELLEILPRLNCTPIGRPDTFLSANGIHFIEQNLSSAIGAYPSIEAATHYFKGHPAIGYLRESYNLSTFSFFETMANYLRPLVDKEGLVCILDVDERGDSVFDVCGVALAGALNELGVPSIWTTWPNLSVSDEGVSVGSRRCSVVLSLFNPAKVCQRFQEFAPLLRGAAEGLYLLLGSPIETITWNKLLMPLLSDPEVNTFLPEEHRKSLSDTLPWTRRVEMTSVRLDGAEVELIPHLKNHRGDYVIKLGNSTLNQHTFVGERYSRDEWDSIVEHAVQEGTWIAQARVRPYRKILPVIQGNALTQFYTEPLCSPYLIDGNVGGFLSLTYGSSMEKVLDLHEEFFGEEGLRNFRYGNLPVFVVEEQ